MLLYKEKKEMDDKCPQTQFYWHFPSHQLEAAARKEATSQENGIHMAIFEAGLNTASLIFTPSVLIAQCLAARISQAHHAMSCSGCVYALKTAIFLNNAAVNMMHLGSFDEAFLTLKNCLALMRVVAVASRYGHFPSDFLSGREIEELMKIPVKLTHEDIAANRAKEHMNYAFEVKTVSSQQDPADFCFQTNLCTTYCFILIEEANFEESEDILRDEIELCSNLMVYNFGLAHCIYPIDGILTSRNNEEWSVREFRQRGFSLLSSCENLFNARLCRGDPLHFQQSTILLASVLLTQAQLQLCRDFYYAAELSQYYLDALETLLLAINLYKEFLPVLPNFAAKAA